MKANLIFELAAGISFLQGLAHGYKHVTAKPTNGPAEETLVHAMKSHYFNRAGFRRSYWDSLFGYGLMIAFACVMQAALLGCLAWLAQTNAAATRPFAVVIAATNVGYAVFVLRYFFLLPAIFDLAIAACMVAAWVVAR